MSKKIFTADLHLQPFESDNIELENGIRLKLQELLNSIEQMLQYGIKSNIDTVIFGGDIGHYRNTIHTRPFYLFQELLLKYTDNFNYIFIPGNHDGSSLYVGQNSVSFFRTMPKTKVLLYPTVIENITYIPDSQNMLNDIKNAEPNDILISHFPLSEGATESGLKITTKFSKKDLKKFKRVYLGDYHTFQKVDHIYYPGSLIPLNKGECGPKGFIVFDDETLETEFVEVTGYRKYINVEIDETTDKKVLNKIIKEAKESNDFITVRNNLSIIPTELKSVIKDIPVIDNFEPEEILRGISSNMDLGEQMKKYLEIQGVPKEDWNKYLNIGLGVLN